MKYENNNGHIADFDMIDEAIRLESISHRKSADFDELSMPDWPFGDEEEFDGKFEVLDFCPECKKKQSVVEGEGISSLTGKHYPIAYCRIATKKKILSLQTFRLFRALIKSQP